MARGYRYDSSVFPSWPYYFAKAGVMAAMALVGRRSHSVLGDPRALLAPTLPYRPGVSPFSRGQSTLVELPISVSPRLRLPAFGTSLVALPNRARVSLLESMRARPFFNLEMHGIDLIGADEDGIPAALVARQHDLRVAHAEAAGAGGVARSAGGRVSLRAASRGAAEVQREGLAHARA